MVTPSPIPDRRNSRIRGYRTLSVAQRASYGAGKEQKAPATRKREGSQRLTLFADDQMLAVASGDSIRVFDADDTAEDAKPIAKVAVRGNIDVLVGLVDGDLVAVGNDGRAWQISSLTGGEPRVRELDGFGGRVTTVVPTRAGLVAVVDREAGRELVAFDAARGVVRRAELPFARIATVSALDDRGSLVVVDERHGAHIVRFDETTDAARIETVQLDADARVTAVAAGPGGLHVIARKGGELRMVRLDVDRGDLQEVCRRVRELLKACGCGCRGAGEPGGPGGGGHPGGEPENPCDKDPDKPGGAGEPGGTGRPGGGRGEPGGGHDDDCDRRHRAQLTWTVSKLGRVGGDLVAISAGGDRFAVLDSKLNVLFERRLRGGTVSLGSPASDRLAVLDRRGAVELWQIGEYLDATGIRPRLDRPGGLAAPAAETAVFHGQRWTPASPNPHLRIAVFPVIEPGQVYSDPDQAKLHALMEANTYSIAQDYFFENSFETLTPEFQSIGVHLAGAGIPLTLPASFASYFWDEFRAGGLQAVMPAAWPAPVELDGRETLEIRTHPSKGSSRDYDMVFAAAWTRRSYAAFPVDVSFTGTETLQVNVTEPDGTAHALSLGFAALNQSLAQGGNESAFLDALGDHVTDAIRAAETTAGSGQILEDVVFRRIRTSTSDSEFGRLQSQWRVSGAGSGKGSIEIVAPGGTVPAGIQALGLAGVGSTLRSGSLTSRAVIDSYLAECLDATIRDAGEGPGLNVTQLLNDPTTTEDAAAQTVTAVIRLTDEYGGSSANIERVASSGMISTGWSTSSPQNGSETTFNNRNALRHSAKLTHDTFTAAMDRIRSQGAWDREAVRAQFAQFDGMMIAFVGPCPTSVPVADRWQCTAAVDKDRLRMFVRRYYATDENDPDPSATPVAMPTDLVIGQRFDRFDAAVMNHEIGHGLGLPDLYSATGFRDDVQYVDDWCNMAGNNGDYNHLCAWSKWFVDWIPESADAAVNRVIDVPMPSPTGVDTTEGWLVPVEYWDNAMRADVEAAVGTGLPIGQMMKIHLGSDGGVIDIAEFRATGASFSQNLSPVPAVVVTNVLDPGTDRRWAVNGLYRRSVHLLNQGNELTSPGDQWDFASAVEFPLKGCVAEVVDIQSIRGGSVPICRLRIEREAAEFVDLYFDDNVPSWRSPDIWVDWRGNNADPDEPDIYPEGTPTDQGEAVRYPGSGSEPHFVVARPHNDGNVHAEDVKVKWFICDPPGAGDDGRWVERDTVTLAQLNDGDWEAIPFPWAVTPDVNDHQCLRAEIIDWTIPTGVDPATGDTVALAGDDVKLQNNMAQKNVFDFEAAT